MRTRQTGSQNRLGPTLLLAAALCLSQPAAALEQGSLAPQFELAGASRTIKLGDYPGKIVYLDFWASWCGPCRQSFPWMNELQAKYGPQGLQIIGVNLDANKEDGLRFLAATPAQFTVAFDASGRSARQYGVKGMPSSVLIGRDGKVAHMHMGFNEASRATLEQAIVVALGSGK